MSDALANIPLFQRAQRREAVTLPAPVPFAAPVFISDCASPLAGETVLSLLWRRLDRDE